MTRMQLGYDKVLVTGGLGFIGSHTVDALLENDAKVWVLDDVSTGQIRNLSRWRNNRSLKVARASILDYRALEAITRRVDGIVHLAAVVSPQVSMKTPEVTNETNVTGTLNVLKAALKSQVHRIVFASSSSVYGDAKSRMINEDCPTNPITPYGVSKLAAEKYCQAFWTAFELESVSLRYFNVYGERQSSNPYSGVIAIFAQKIKKGLRPTIYGNGRQTRDFIHVSDVARANLLALRNSRGIGEAFNIGTGVPSSINELFSKLLRILNKNVRPIYKDERPGDIEHSCADTSKAQKYLRFTSTVTLQEGLARMEHRRFNKIKV